MDTSYLAETTLGKLSPELHKRYTECFAAADTLLGRYQHNFPTYTDHSLLHSMEVTNLANALIWNRISALCAEELYILLMGALLHDVGMGYSVEELEKSRPLDYEHYMGTHSRANVQDFIRRQHHELSALFVMQNWGNCRIPDETMASAVAEVCRGHRKTDLMDRTHYPTHAKIGSGVVNMAYLAAVVRLADELDISASRNLSLHYAGYVPEDHLSVAEFQKHRALRSDFADDSFVMKGETNSRTEYDSLLDLYGKVEETLDYCQQVVRSSTGDDLPVRYVVNEIKFIGSDISLIIDTNRSGDTLRIALTGKLDTVTSPLLDEKLSAQFGGGVKNLVLDCRRLDYVSSYGLRIILGAKKKSMAMQGEMTVINVPASVMEIFGMTGFSSLLGLDDESQ